MELEVFCQPSSYFRKKGVKNPENGTLLSLVRPFIKEIPNLKGVKIAILGVEEDRLAVNNSCIGGADIIRKYLYQLSSAEFKSPIVDLGNIYAGNEIKDTHFALQSVLEFLLKKNIVTIIIGGSQDLTYNTFLAYKNLEKTVNLVTIDSKFDLGSEDSTLNSQSYLSKIILHEPNYLFNYSQIGYQSYFVKQEETDLMAKLFFESYKLGHIRENLNETEPIVRDADIISFDIGSIKQTEAPANNNASANGFYNEEACAICRYAGMSEQLSIIGFYEFNPLLDNNDQTAKQLSQMIWYFIEGYNNRKNENPAKISGFYKYRVHDIDGTNEELIFYKSKKSDRWWIEVSVPSRKSKYERHYLVPCSYKDYLDCCKKELPNRWWKAYQKLM